jgi:hypothetical protein
VRVAFFAPGNDPSVWRGGWNVPTMKMQIAVYRATSVDDWWSAGGQKAAQQPRREASGLFACALLLTWYTSQVWQQRSERHGGTTCHFRG